MPSAHFITHFILPDIAGYTGRFFKSKCNPHLVPAEASAHSWFDSYGIYSGDKRDKFFKSRFCLLAALCFPEADLEHIRPGMDYFLWVFAYDDIAEIGGFSPARNMTVDITMNALGSPGATTPELEVVATSQSFFNRMRLNGIPKVIQRLIDSLDEYNRAIIEESIRRAETQVETIEEYVASRQITSGGMPTLVVMEYAHAVELPDHVYDHPVIKGLAVAAVDILAWANDVYSFPAEHSNGQVHNFVYVVMHNKQVGLQDAVDYVYQRIQARVQEYMALKAQLPSFGPVIDKQVSRYVQGIEYVAQGCIEWYCVTPRYLVADEKEVKRNGVVKLRAPLVVPQIISV